MENKAKFLQDINIRNKLEYRYKELLRKLKILTNTILKMNNSENDKNNILLKDLSRISVLYPEKTDVVENIIELVYGEKILTENSLNEFEKLYEEIYEIKNGKEMIK